MPRFLFHVYNDDITIDEEGQELPDEQAARQVAIESARDLMCKDVRAGRLRLADRIEVEDEVRLPLFTMRFRDAIKLL